MTIKVYFNNAAPDLTPPAWRYSPYGKTTGAVQKALGLTKAGANASLAQSETSTSATYDMPHGSWTSPPFLRDASLTTSETIGLTMGRQANAASSFYSLLHIYVMKPDGSVRGTLMSKTGTSYWGTGAQNGGWNAAAITALDVVYGDRLVFEIGVRAANTTATTRTATIWYGGTGTDFVLATPGDANVTTKVGNAELTGANLEALWTAPTTTTPTSVLDIGPVPDTNHFDIQLAVPGAGSVEIHTQSEIGSGYKFYPWYYGNAAGTRCIMRAPADGPVLGTSARCEHREVNPDGTDAAFDATVGSHIMHGRSMITHSPTALPDIVLAQLHNGTTDRIAFRTQFVTSSLRLRLRVNGTYTGSELATAGAANIENVEWEWKIEVINNVVKFYLTDMVTPVYTSAPNILVSTGDTWYFKTGCYLQTTTDGSGEYGQVELRDLWHSHATTGPEPGRRMMAAA